MFEPQRIGRALRALRIRSGLRQLDVAKRAKVSRAFVSKVERGFFRTSDISRVERICLVLGADLDVRVRWRGEGLDRLLDEGHASLVDAVVSVRQAGGWESFLEVTFNEYGERGSIDVLAWNARELAVLVVEVKSVVPDAQGTLAPLDRKTRLGPKLARDRGWSPSHVGRLLVLEEGATNRRRVERFAALFDAALRSRNVAVRRWLSRPVGSLNGLLFLSSATPGSTRRTTAGRQRVRRPQALDSSHMAAPGGIRAQCSASRRPRGRSGQSCDTTRAV